MCKDTINQRFIFSVDYIISEKIAPTKASIAQNLDIKTSKFSEILNKRMSVSAELLSNFSKKYGFSVEWILTGEGNMLKSSSKISPSVAPVPSPVQADQSPGPECMLCKEKDLRIVDLQKSVEFWQDNFKSMGKVLEVVLKSNKAEIDTLKAQVDDLQQQHFDTDDTITSQAG